MQRQLRELLSLIIFFPLPPPSASLQEDSLPLTVIGIFIEQRTPFLDQFFKRLQLLHYPKKKIHLFIHNHVSRVIWLRRRGPPAPPPLTPSSSRFITHTRTTGECASRHVQEEHHLSQVSSFVDKHGQEYRSLKVMGPQDNLENADARNLSM